MQSIADATLIVAAIPPVLKRSPSGDVAVLFRAIHSNAEGALEDPDDNELLIRIVKADATFITDRLYQQAALSGALANPTDTTVFPAASGWRKMVRDAAGVFSAFYKNSSSHTEEVLTIEVACEEDSNVVRTPYVVEIVDAANLDTITTDLDTLKTRIPGTVEAQTGDSFARLGVPVNGSIAIDIADVEGKIDELETRIPGVVQAQTGDSFARLGAPVNASVALDIAGVQNAIGAWTNAARATVSCAASTETDLVAEVTITKPTRVIVHMDLTNLTVAATINIYEDGGAAGTALTKIDPSKSWVTTDNKIVAIEFWALADYKVTITTGAEGANRDVYVRHSRQVTV